jgi:hypothetical protein
MAFARPIRLPPSTLAPAPTAAAAKLVSLKELKKFRKSVNDKVENTKEDMSSVFSQLQSLGDAFDTLSQV